jgi:hypothetical protein
MTSARRWLVAAALLPAALLVAACADDPAPGIAARVPAALGAGAVRDAVAAHSPAVLVALDAEALAIAREGAPDLRTVAIGERLAAAPARAALETIVVEDTGAAVAIELALLAANGVALPPVVELGTRTLTAANAAAGGAVRPGPGDFGMAALRRQHADAVTTSPSVDVVFAVAFVQVGVAGEWHARVRAAVEADARRYPQLALRVEEATSDAGAVAAVVRRCAADGVRAVVVVGAGTLLRDAVAAASEAKVAVVALCRSPEAVPGACIVGQSPAVLARAVADAALPAAGAGALVVVHGDLASPVVARRLEALDRTTVARAAASEAAVRPKDGR